MFVLHKKENNICKIMCVTYVQQDNVQRLSSAMAFIFTDTERKKKKQLKSVLTLSDYCLSSTRPISDWIGCHVL